MKKEILKRNLENCNPRDNEDMPVIDLINKINCGQEITLLEVGSGECRFVKKVASLYPNIKITCIEVNPELAQIARELGFEVLNDNILNIHSKKEYDIVHCAHVIEHFGYPQVTQLLEFLVASTKKGAYMIIRSPLMHRDFYIDIDHVRPYPPDAILNYFYLSQQQTQGKAKPQTETIWYRTVPKKIDYLSTSDYLYLLSPLRRYINWCIRQVNNLFSYTWNKYRMPSSHPTGYVLILRINEK